MIQLGYSTTTTKEGHELKTWIFKGRKCTLDILKNEHFIESGRVENLSKGQAIILDTPKIFRNNSSAIGRIFQTPSKRIFTVTQIIREVAI